MLHYLVVTLYLVRILESTSTQASNSTKKILSALAPSPYHQSPPTKSLAGILKNSHFTCAKSTDSPGKNSKQLSAEEGSSSR